MITTKLKIRTLGDPCLKKVSAPVKNAGPAERLLFASMVETMYAADGVGLAAPQVGVNQRIFVVDVGDGPEVMMNPKILKTSGSIEMEEGCLSIPGVHIMIKRPQKVSLRFIDHKGQEKEGVYEDLKARAILHEIDHLDGKTIVDHAGKSDLKKFQKEIDILIKSNDTK
jgi:peptide deformylase